MSWSFLSSLIEGRGVKFPLLQGPQALEQLVGRPQSPSERCCCVSIRFSPSIRKSMWCWRMHSKSIEAKQLGNHAGTCRHSQDRLFCVARWCWDFEQNCVNGFALPFLRPILQPGCLVPCRSPQATDSLTPRHAQSFCPQAAWRGLCGRPQESPRLRLLRLAPKARTPARRKQGELPCIDLPGPFPARRPGQVSERRQLGPWALPCPNLGSARRQFHGLTARSCRRCQGCSRWYGHLSCRRGRHL